jgi:hypothetical protein
MFGWHVHEKAVLYAVIPAWLAAMEAVAGGGDGDERGRRGGTTSVTAGKGGASSGTAAGGAASSLAATWTFTLAAHYCQLPLIFTPVEKPLAALLVATFAVWSWVLLRQVAGTGAAAVGGGQHHLPLALSHVQAAYAGGFVALHAFVVLAPGLLPGLPFLPLMATSLYCFAGVAAAWLRGLREA